MCENTAISFEGNCFKFGRSTQNILGPLSFERFYSDTYYDGKTWKFLLETNPNLRDYSASGVNTKIAGSDIKMRGTVLESFFK